MIFYISLVAITGLIIGYLVAQIRFGNQSEPLKEALSKSSADTAMLNERLNLQKETLAELTKNLDEERKNNLDLNWKAAQLDNENKNLNEKLLTQKSEIENLQESFRKEFENLAHKILEEKSQKFTELNRSNLDIILNPLKEKIQSFEQKVDQTYKTESAERNSLKGEIKTLVELNKMIGDEAKNLTNALKADTKKQGNWGELILEKVLERSGLSKGVEYKIQVSLNDHENNRVQPDVVIMLPEDKHVIVDSKVSLVAWELFVNSANEEEKSKHLASHLQSIRNHVRSLSEKNYHSASGVNSPDFVLLFMPLESAFSIAVQSDNELWNFAWDKKIVIVSPTTLLATLKTISSIWKQERQNRNALEIADQGGKLYDKFVAFVEDLTEVGKKMDQAKSSYVDAMKKLSEGKGNLVRSTEKLRELGVKSNKQLTTGLIERSTE